MLATDLFSLLGFIKSIQIIFMILDLVLNFYDPESSLSSSLNQVKCFWPKTQQRFTQCDLCFHFKNHMQTATSIEEKLGALIRYREHLASQYADRAFQWTLQELALDDTSDLIVCQIDGMDQGKYRLPRDPKLKATASVPLGPESFGLWT